jgi:hypothetical protein
MEDKTGKEKEMNVYEVCVLNSKEDCLEEKLNRYQGQGWQICGDVLVKNESGHCLDTYVFIPLKRKKK